MKKITVKYTLEIPEDKFEKISRLGQCGKRELEQDIKKMAEVTGRHRVYEFTDGMLQLNKQENKINEES